MPKKGENPRLPLSDSWFKPTFQNGPIEHPGAPSGPGSTAMEAARNFRKRVHSVVENATPQFVTPKDK